MTGNNFLGNGGTELNTNSSLYDLAFRNYDPVLGRMNGVDPMASKYASLSPYNFSFNDPVTFNDPSGAEPPTPAYGGHFFDWDLGSHYTTYTYDDRVDYRYQGSWHAGVTSSSLAFHTGGRNGGLRSEISSWAPNFYGPVYDAESGQYRLAEYHQGAWGYWFDQNSIEYEYFVDKDGNLARRGAVVVGSKFVAIDQGQTQVSGPGDGLNWAAGGRALVRALVPFGSEIYPEEDEPDFDPRKKVMSATVPDLPIGPQGGAKLTARAIRLLIKENGIWKWAVNGRVASKETLKASGLIPPSVTPVVGKPSVTKEFVESVSGVQTSLGPKSAWQKIKEAIAILGQIEF